MESIGGLAETYNDPKAVATISAGTMGGATIGTVMGGGLGTPLTTSGGALLGAGSAALSWKAGHTMEVEAGLAYNEMIKNGVTPGTARLVAEGIGIGSAALELLPVDDLVDAFGILNKTGATKGAAAKVADYLCRVGLGTLVDTAGSGIKIAGVQGATKADTGEWAYDTDEVRDRLLNGLGSSVVKNSVVYMPKSFWRTGTMPDGQMQVDAQQPFFADQYNQRGAGSPNIPEQYWWFRDRGNP